MTRPTRTRFLLLLPAGLMFAFGVWAADPSTPTKAGEAAPTVADPTSTATGQAANTPPTQQTLKPVSSLQDEMLGGIDWEHNMVYAVGDGVPPADAINPAQARVRAKRAATDEAMAGLLEAVQAVRVDAESTTRDYINESRAVNTAVSGLIRNAETVELRQADDGSYQIKMRMPINDQNGLSSTLLPLALSQVYKVAIVTRVVRTDAAPSTQSAAPKAAAAPAPLQDQPPAAPTAYTALIVDATGIGAQAAMFPRVLSPTGQVLYDLATADPNPAVTTGLCAYRKSLDQARKDPRAGANPLVLKATEAAGTGRTDLVVDDAGAAQIAALSSGGLLRDAKVIVVTD